MSIDDETLLKLFDQHVRRDCRCVGHQVEHLNRVTRVTGPSASPSENFIVWSDLDENSADREIEIHHAYFKKLGHSCEWYVYNHDQPKDLVDRLTNHGFVIDSEETLVICKSSEIKPVPSPHNVLIRKLDHPRDIPDSLHVSDLVWGTQYHDFVTRWLTHLVKDHPEDSTVLVAYNHDQPVGTSWAIHWRGSPFASLFGGTVLPEWRGQGIYRAMVAERATAAAATGNDWCAVDAGSESFPILKRLGFQPLTKRTCLCWENGKE
jgi:GNAT superfamily N-acetyltransferase